MYSNDSNYSYELEEIRERLNGDKLPFSGITRLGSAAFYFREPSFYAGTAIHAGSLIREELHPNLAAGKAERYREEDPGTEKFMAGFPLQLIARYSRFEYDINRPEDKAIPLTPDMSWGINIWKRTPTAEEIAKSLLKYHEFHGLLDILADYLVHRFSRAYIFDLHSYNYQRTERRPWYEDQKPEINLGTEAINQSIFRQAIDHYIKHLANITVEGRSIRVAENEVFKGGYLARRLSARHYNSLAVFAIEFKKIFMDEWSGRFFVPVFIELTEKFSAAVNDFVDVL